ncbi:MAG: SDR family NAD(P)-dependent oxidoreductase [candidate division Zixibacteria bacterium]|nr:SDR family NAD(P)-dependent oxidoreductase [candidate division Zixibacteria bacterium]
MKLAGKKVLVTGAGGFIGSHLVETLASHDCQLRCFIRYTSRSDRGWLEALPENVKDGLEIVAGDLKNPDAVRNAVQSCDLVFHLGALVGIPYSYTDPRDYVDTNVIGTTNVLTAAADFEVDRIIHVSTSEVYGSAQYVPIDEKHAKVAQSPYSASKIAADMMAESFHHSFGLPVTVIRPFNTFGPRQSLRAVIPTIITQLLIGSELKLGSTTPTRDFTYISDTVAGLIKGAESDEAVGRTVNLGTGIEVSIGALAEKIASLLGKEYHYEPDSRRVRPQSSEVSRLLADNSLAQSLLDWKPQVSLADGLNRTIEWFRENLRGFRPQEYAI